jgi:hypothetical protein
MVKFPLEVDACAHIAEIEAVQRHRDMIFAGVDQAELGLIEVLVNGVEMHGGRLERLIERKKPHINVGADDLVVAWLQHTGRKDGTTDQPIGQNAP